MLKKTGIPIAIFIMWAAISYAAAGAVSSIRPVTATGFIQKQGITSYMYGTHVLLDAKGKTLYALRSKTVRLDKYIGKTVTVTGNLIEGYPVDNGPQYLDVKAVK